MLPVTFKSLAAADRAEAQFALASLLSLPIYEQTDYLAISRQAFVNNGIVELAQDDLLLERQRLRDLRLATDQAVQFWTKVRTAHSRIQLTEQSFFHTRRESPRAILAAAHEAMLGGSASTPVATDMAGQPIGRRNVSAAHDVGAYVAYEGRTAVCIGRFSMALTLQRNFEPAYLAHFIVRDLQDCYTKAAVAVRHFAPTIRLTRLERCLARFMASQRG